MLRATLLLIFLLPSIGLAEVFETSYLWIDLPNNWSCRRDKTLWSCRDYGIKKSAYFIHLIAKKASPDDTLAKFTADLQKPIIIKTKSETPIQSQVASVKNITVNDHRWVQALHNNGVLEGYSKYYMMTVKNGIAIKVTFSLSSDKYQEKKDILTKSMYSLKVKSMDFLRAEQNTGPEPIADDSEVAGVDQSFLQNLIQKIKTPKGMLIALGGLFLMFFISTRGKPRKKKKS